MNPETIPQPPAAPWWRHGLVWLVIAGPAAAVAAGVVTVVIALGQPDPLVNGRAQPGAIRLEGQSVRERALLPAQQARNHAATPSVQR